MQRSLIIAALLTCAAALLLTGAAAEREGPATVTTLNPGYTLDRHALSGGGATAAGTGTYTLGHTVGQSHADRSASTNYDMIIGFWTGAAAGTCLVAMTGDVNINGAVTSADIIYLVTYVFKGGAPPQPCAAAGDVNCDGSITSADIIYLVNFVFKGGPPPCDVCTTIPGTWTCP